MLVQPPLLRRIDASNGGVESINGLGIAVERFLCSEVEHDEFVNSMIVSARSLWLECLINAPSPIDDLLCKILEPSLPGRAT